MSALVATAAEPQPTTFYSRYKQLALAASAGVLLGRPDAAIAGEARTLAADAARALVHPSADDAALRACRAAAEALARMVEVGDDADVRRARESHGELRRWMGASLTNHYAPCGGHREHGGCNHG